MFKGLNKFIKKHLRNVVFFGTLAIAVIFSILSFIPNLPFVITYHIPFFVLIVAMGEFYLIAHKYIIPEKGILVSKNFRDNTEHLTNISAKDGKIALLESFGYNTNTYHGAIKSALRSNKVTINEMKILVYKGDKYDKSELKSNIARWHELKNDGKIANVSVRFYDFEPSFYFTLYCGKFLHWGIFKRTTGKTYPFDTSVDYAVLGHDKVSDSLISEMQEFFTNIWQNHSSQDEEFIKNCMKKI